MSCKRPLEGWRAHSPSPKTGKYRVVFNLNEGDPSRPVKVPCGKCTGCRLEKSRQWGVRIMHEAKFRSRSCFITLTYADDHLPPGGTLVLKDYQHFLKRLRKNGPPIKFYGCGEYGDEDNPNRIRASHPHYHFCITNLDFDDRKFLKWSNSGEPVYTSALLERLWPFGFSSLGAVNFQSAAYVARYTMKKVLGATKQAQEMRDAKLNGRLPEFGTMSNGIGRAFLIQNHQDIYRNDSVIVKGHESRPPRYYDTWAEKECQGLFSRALQKRALDKKENLWDNTSSRQKVQEDVLDAKVKFLKRDL